MEATVSLVREIDPDLDVRSGMDVAKKMLAASGEIR
jgi:hypothetical protein